MGENIIKVDREIYIAKVKELYEARKSYGSMESVGDFMAGALAVFDAAGEFDKAPPGWIIGVMAGRDPFTLEPNEEEEA